MSATLSEPTVRLKSLSKNAGLMVCTPAPSSFPGKGNKNICEISCVPVTDSDPYVFGHPRSGSITFCTNPDPVSYASFNKQKKIKKNLDFYCFVTSLWLFPFEEWCKCIFKKEISIPYLDRKAFLSQKRNARPLEKSFNNRIHTNLEGFLKVPPRRSYR